MRKQKSTNFSSKRKHLQKNLSAAQRDKILIDESKEDARFRKEMAEAIKESTKCFSESVKCMSESMVQMTSTIGRSMEVMAQAMLLQNQNQSQQNFYARPEDLLANLLNGYQNVENDSSN